MSDELNIGTALHNRSHSIEGQENILRSQGRVGCDCGGGRRRREFRNFGVRGALSHGGDAFGSLKDISLMKTNKITLLQNVSLGALTGAPATF